jgi:hypothetical protein
MPREGELICWIATDCISEGQTLQDCDYLIKLTMTSIGIQFELSSDLAALTELKRQPGCSASELLTKQDLNKYINLKNRVEARMALADMATTQEDNTLNVEEPQDVIKDDLKYRDKQLLRLKDEILDLEDL